MALCTLPSKRPWAWVVVLSSAGKDSQTALKQTVEACDQAGFPRDRIVVSYQDLGKMVWDGTKELAHQQAAHYGLRVEVSRYRARDKSEPSLFDYARMRGKWPSNKQRWCTSEFKRGPGNRVLTKLRREDPGHILQVFGFRAEESAARAKRPPLSRNSRAGTSRYQVWDWLPIHDWTEQQVWQDIKASGVPHHFAYDLGMHRLSCVLCIFAPRRSLMLAGKHNPALLQEAVELEQEIGHTFRQDQSLREIQAALLAGEEIPTTESEWKM